MMKGRFFLAVFVCLFLAGLAQAENTLKVLETSVKAHTIADRLRVDLTVESDFRQKTAAKLRLEILDANDRIVAQNDSLEKLGNGQNDLAVALPIGKENKVRDLLWYRLRYSLEAGGKSAGGIISLSEIMPELFELRVSAAEKISAGTKYLARVHAFHPAKNTPAADVEINGKLTFDLETEADEDELVLKAAGRTDAEGFAVLEFEIPSNVKFPDDESGEIEVFGRKNGLLGEADEDLETGESETSIYFTTDKPLYQPGQKIFARGLALRKNAIDSGLTVDAEKEFEFSIRDEDETVLFRQKLTTSRFGIAALEWQIPPNAKLGTYRIEAESDEGLGANRTSFKVSRYDLPNFVVQTKAGKDFYLPDQPQAEVTVDALYLFGKPVAGGKVRVVQESRRQWNYGEQKWDVQEEAVYEGEADAAGKYVARIDLSKAHENLKNNESAKFEDLNFTAYFTDSSTNKTEQRRFDLRVTKEPIHVYLTKAKGRDNNPKLPLAVYVTAYSADGKPCAACEVEITGKYEDEKDSPMRPLATLKTDSLGAGKAEFFAPKREDDIYFDDLDLKVSARDAADRTGTNSLGFELDEDEKQIVVRTDKTIYRKGESLKIEILSSETDRTVFVDVLKHFSSLQSRRLKLKSGRAVVKIPYDPNFKSYLTVSAYFDDDGAAVEDARTVVYPTTRALRVNTETNKEVFRPNEEAAMSFSVSTADKKQAESALGVVILDQAVEERARTDANFGGAVDIFEGLSDLAGNSWDETDTKNLSPEQQLLAERVFAANYFRNNFFGSDYPDLKYVFTARLEKQFENVGKAFNTRYRETFEHPTDDASLRKILSGEGIDFDALRDPWGSPFRAGFEIYYRNDVIVIKSAGANKIFGDGDDFEVVRYYFEYFKKTGGEIDRAIGDYVQKTGRFVRDVETLRGALAEKNIDLDNIKDRWGAPYNISFGVTNRNYTIGFESVGPRKDETYDNFSVWTTTTDYFAEPEKKIAAILDKFIAEKKTFPQTEAEFKQILRDGGLDFDALRDGWNRPYFLKYDTQTQFADRIIVETTAKQGETPKETLSITPVTRQLGIFYVRSFGTEIALPQNGNYDVWIGSFAGIISEQLKDDAKPKVVIPKSSFTKGKSVIYGVVTDAQKAIIANADVTLTNLETQAAATVKTNADGVYLQTDLAAGKYSVRASANGFKASVVDQIKVDAERIVEINLMLEVGAVSETVTVTAGAAMMVETSSSQISISGSRQFVTQLPINGRNASGLYLLVPGVVKTVSVSGGVLTKDGASGREDPFTENFWRRSEGEKNELPAKEQKTTPRLREYFPETLLWIPELVTDKSGKISIKFRLADNITTWKIYAVASDTNGRVGVTSKEIKAFQPFFVDLEPPKFLTEGDEIFLPAQIRNYTQAAQRVNVEMAPADWFKFLDAGRREIEVAPNATGNTVFGFKTVAAVEGGKQTVTALAEKDSDAIEKPVTVRPNGQEIVRTESRLFAGSAAFDVDFPENALPKTSRAELKIYPNLMAHVTESVEGLLRRPYGCGEQTISSTYPNLMILKFKSESVGGALRQKAKRYLQKGYERLLGYQVADGGFSYWGGKDSSDVALTAYALRFLADARGFLEVDAKVIENAQAYLIRQQRADGSFTKKYAWEKTEDAGRTRLFTSYVARTLAQLKTEKSVLDKALAYLKTRNAEIAEPYALALYGLASLDAGNLETAREVAQRLEKMALTEGDKVYWNLETNTPFYGWGTAGRIETTALVLQLLVRLNAEQPADGELIAKATMFLLKNKDRYGVWYSTQTTINVLDAFLASLAPGRAQTLTVSMNGEKLKEITVAADQIETVAVDLNGKLTGANRLEITSSDNSTVMAQIVKTHYIDWKDAQISDRNVNDSRAIRLDYKCDKQQPKIMETVTCAVEAERIGFQGYGMLLAEIGLPPGADVSRESLDKALEADWSLSRYDILPDRIVLYMWSKAGGSRFNFSFKPRYGIDAQTPASVIYDYYNEESKGTVAPLRFEVK
jgi:hypothetical protein